MPKQQQVPMISANIRLSQEHADALRAHGGGSLTEGVRKFAQALIKRTKENER